MSNAEAVRKLFTAFGQQRNEEQAELYTTEIAAIIRCGDCCEIAAENLMRTAKRLPTLAQLIEEARYVIDSDKHTPHISIPMLAPRVETWWRTEAVNIIAPKTEGDRDLASFIAAQMWWSLVRPTADDVSAEIQAPIWVTSARLWLADKPLPPLIEAAYRRARWQEEHEMTDDMPRDLIELKID